MSEKKLGVIRSVKFGFGGYQGCMLGLSLDFDFKGTGVGAFINGGWTIDRSEHAKWTEADRIKQQADLCAQLIKLMNKAKIDDVTKLKGIPVEVELEGNALKDWRILEEAIL